MSTIKIADFFAGVGGIRLGFEKSHKKYQCVFTNEIDKYAIKTYEKNFPTHKVNNISIVDLKSTDIPDFDVFLGGFPCQPFSIAGHRKGFEDDRGNLFVHIARILRDKKPCAILLENVKNLQSHDKGRTIQIICNTLNDIGYSLRYKVLNSAKHGNIPQNRERIFIVGFLDCETAEKFRFPYEEKLTSQVCEHLQEQVPEKYIYTNRIKIYPILKENITQDIENNIVYQFRRQYVRENKSGVCPTLTANMGGGGHNVPIIFHKNNIRKLTPRECFNLQGFPLDFDLPSFISDTQLYKQAGNSVTVTVIQKLAKNMYKAIKGKNVKGDKGTLVKKYAKIIFED